MYLVTGGAGFIGSHIVTRLLQRGDTVRVLDNLSSGSTANLQDVADDVELIVGDLRDADTLRRALQGVEVVFHEAAVASVPMSIEDPQTCFDVNVNGTLSLLLAARDAGCRRVLLASSSAVYGNSPVSPKLETLTPEPMSPYAITKLTGEQIFSVFANLYALETVALRYFNVFGPRQDPNSQYSAVIPKFIHALQNGEVPTIYGDGEQSRDFVFIDNVVDANLKAAGADGVSGKVFNVASGRAVTVNQMLHNVAAFLDVPANAHYAPPRAGDIRDSLADVTAARESLGLSDGVPFEEGLQRTVEAFRRSPVR